MAGTQKRITLPDVTFFFVCEGTRRGAGWRCLREPHAEAVSSVFVFHCAELRSSPNASLIFVFRRDRAIGLRRRDYAQIVLNTVVPPLLTHLAQASSSYNDNVSSSVVAGGVGSGIGGLNAVKHSFSALVELSELPDVFAVVVPAMLAGGRFFSLNITLRSGFCAIQLTGCCLQMAKKFVAYNAMRGTKCKTADHEHLRSTYVRRHCV